jgi:hypothetical protein
MTLIGLRSSRAHDADESDGGNGAAKDILHS